MTDLPDVWQLDIDSPDWLPSILTRLLTAGIPPTALANAFEMDVEPIRELLRDLRIRKYGASEMAEIYTQLMLTALDDIRQDIALAPLARRIQLNMVLISKVSALVGNQTPDSMAKMQGEIEAMTAEMRGTTEEASSSIYEVITDDAPIDNPEERPAS